MNMSRYKIMLQFLKVLFIPCQCLMTKITFLTVLICRYRHIGFWSVPNTSKRRNIYIINCELFQSNEYGEIDRRVHALL